MPNSIQAILLDFSYTLCFPKTKESVESLNGLYTQIKNANSQANPLDSFILNQELLDELTRLKSTHKLYIFTSGYMHTDPKISPLLQPIFDGFFTSTQLKLPKSFPDAYKVIANRIDVPVESILFIDDQQKNINAASTAGAQAIRFTNNTQVIEAIKKYTQK